LETGAIPEAVESLDRGKARLWQTAAVGATAEQIRTLIPAGGALLFPVFAGPRGAVAIATEAGWDVAWLESLGRKQIRSIVLGEGKVPKPENLTSLTGWVYLYATRHVNATRWKKEIDTIGDLLYHDLWQPLQQRLDALNVVHQKELVWFPQGVSCVLPIHSARYHTDDGLHYITEDYALRYAPAAAILLSAPATHPGVYTLVANPEFANPKYNLPYSELELELVRQSLREHEIVVLTRTEVRREAVLARLSVSEIFHFSGHAYFRLDDPFHSGLVMALANTVSLEDLQPLLRENPPSMVVLSACQTAMAQVTTRPDEALGFPAMFLSHGVRIVVATLWPVDDLASALLIGQFYRFWKHDNQSPAYALRSAQNWLRTATVASISDLLKPLKKVSGPVRVMAAKAPDLSKRDAEMRPFAHPEFWAAFLVAGQPQP
jgi:CHAT domain-containing protein